MVIVSFFKTDPGLRSLVVKLKNKIKIVAAMPTAPIKYYSFFLSNVGFYLPSVLYFFVINFFLRQTEHLVLFIIVFFFVNIIYRFDIFFVIRSFYRLYYSLIVN